MRCETIGDTLEIYFRKSEEEYIDFIIKVLISDFDCIPFDYRLADNRIGLGMVAFCARQYPTQKEMKKAYFAAKLKAAKQIDLIDRIKWHERAIQNVKNRNLL